MAENKTIQLDVETNLGSLRTQLKNAQAEVAILSEKFGATSTEAANAAKKAAELKDRIADAKALTDAFNPDAKFNSLTTSIGGALNGFQAFEGALGVMGVESEDLQKQLLKVQSAMALSQGLQGLGEAKDSFIQLGSVVKDVVVKSFTTLRGAIMATGIGTLVVSIGYLVNKYIEASNSSKVYKESVDKMKDSLKDANVKISEMNNTFELARKGVISKKKALYDYNEELGFAFGKAKNLNEAEKLFRDKTEAFIKAVGLRAQASALYEKSAEELSNKQTAKLQDNTSTIDKLLSFGQVLFGIQTNNIRKSADGIKNLSDAQKENTQELISNSEKRANVYKTEADKLMAQAIELEKSNGIKSESDKSYYDNEKELAEKAAERRKELNEKIIKAYDDYYNELDSREKNAIENAILEIMKKSDNEVAILDEALKRKIISEQEYNKQVKIININAQNEINKIKTEKQISAEKEANRLRIEQENAFQLQIEDIDEANFQARLQSSMSNQDYELEQVRQKYFTLEELAKGNAEQEKIIEEAKQRDITEINKRYNTKRWEMASQALSILSDATTLFTAKNEKDARTQFKIQKAFNLSSAIINTGLAVTAALTGGGNVAKIASSMNFVEAGIAAAAGAVNIAKIAATQFSANGGGGGSDVPQPSASVSQSMTPTFNISGGNQTSQLLQGLQAQPLKAYVVSSDITSAQLLDQKAIKTSVL